MNIRDMDAYDWMDDKSWYKLVGDNVVLTEAAPPEMVKSFEKWLRINGYAHDGYPVMNDKLFEFLALNNIDKENHNVAFLTNYRGWSYFNVTDIKAECAQKFPTIVKAKDSKYKFASKKKTIKLAKFLKRERRQIKKSEDERRKKLGNNIAEFDRSLPPMIIVSKKAYLKAIQKAEKIKRRLDKQIKVAKPIS